MKITNLKNTYLDGCFYQTELCCLQKQTAAIVKNFPIVGFLACLKIWYLHTYSNSCEYQIRTIKNSV